MFWGHGGEGKALRDPIDSHKKNKYALASEKPRSHALAKFHTTVKMEQSVGVELSEDRYQQTN